MGHCPDEVVFQIGKMELFCGPFKEAVLQAINGPQTVVGTAMLRPNPWLDALKALPQVTVWEVTSDTRDGMADEVVRWVGP